ncbi:VCBS repeat-containing protein [Pseudenhygromyxa sp. WMMC2535]|uniref:FG-GAP-like repeat-containing protein n=1 Tax=Pseudenhygromyxa sp. WMMC2535 TaxID=2712867 RepID=UPI001553BE7C|nr:FG-GAP-like repeat-containing protein [Pseudenhygromyxa sp. WMMC2535]NVB40569.1 VCBS repeat-containing protein [Pseudenhygromyxa sp. WMMC2535]
MRRSVFVLALAPTLLFACGDSGASDDDVGTSEDGIGTEATGEDSSSSTLDTGLDTGTGGCDNPCGDECCGGDEVCDEDNLVCVLDCGDDDPCGVDDPVCCGGGEICYVGQCVTPGGACSELSCATQTESDCEEDEICDGELGLCVPNLVNEACTFTPEEGVFDPIPRWTWGARQPRSCDADADCQKEEVCTEGSCAVTWTHHEIADDDWPTHVQVMAAPMVADLDGDCVPEVIFNSYDPSDWQNDGILRVLHGDTGEKLWTLGDEAWRSDGTGIPAIGDIDYDGDLEIVNVGDDSHLHLIDHEGNPVWTTVDVYAGNQTSGAPAIANFDLQGDAEIAYGRAIYDSDGNELWAGEGGFGSNASYAVLSCVADLDGDSRPELIGGGTVYTFTGTVGTDFAGEVLWESGGDGYCGVADFQLDGVPELVLVRQGSIDVLDGPTGTLLAQFEIPGGGMGGPPNIADFDGDGFPDIGLAGGARYVVVSFDGVDTLTKLWDAETKDVSSNRTGSSVFDFDGDGRNEVIYGDEWYLRIYPGVEPDCQLDPPGAACDQDMTDDEILFIDITSSGTRVEYPVIADVDGDFKAEIVVSTNNNFSEGSIGDSGVEVFEDRLDNWVGTLPIWNQHTYHITNVDAKGSIPIVEDNNWEYPAGSPYNSYRRNTQGGVENCAPDLVAQDLTTVGACQSEVTFSVRVCNQGCLGVGPGVDVSFSEAEFGALGTVTTEAAIPAGGCISVELTMDAPGTAPYDVSVTVDDDGDGGAFNECVEDNNSFGPVELCPNIG